MLIKEIVKAVVTVSLVVNKAEGVGIALDVLLEELGSGLPLPICGVLVVNVVVFTGCYRSISIKHKEVIK